MITYEISSRQMRSIVLPNLNLPGSFPNAQLLCYPFSNHRCTCTAVHDCLNFFPSNGNSDRQEGSMSGSASDGWRHTPYLFPDSLSSSDPNSVMRKCPLSVRAFLLAGVTVKMQTGGICAYVAIVGGLITPLLIYMPFLYVARPLNS